MAGTLHWIARSIVFWRDGVMASKSGALRREIKRGSPHAGAFALALEIRRRGARHAEEYRTELSNHLDRTARSSAREIRGYAVQHGRNQVR